ncbi:helix-turn-helix domain-containing protein [Adlercreutzia sp. R25]|uniref:Helix-turn-helix domain-containing protein n=1 Tax=Adlercreutzia shanghongiae TaxID=3111773 RepID=A0ABU6IYI1_9ACTN|nr:MULTISPECIES: helix-turn-helix domain-containing protein [unclassified Adlercreutzia]MEC4271880.1 helix-turn-helix domain-containing protein [Adlercreutzia sp. R25]MEC4294884.1 helix-turn-helix domain-containing protein [Adlercreutzia sp. R22]
MGELTIGQMARLNGVSEKTLRFYQELGLLAPSRVDAHTGYRYYRLDQCLVIDMIQRLQQLGFTLREIADIAASENVEALAAALDERRAAYDEQRRDIERRMDLIDALSNNCRLFLSHPVLFRPMFVQRPPLSVLALPSEAYGAESEVVHDDVSVQNWGLATRFLKKALADRGWPDALFRDVGIVIPETDGEYDKANCMLAVVAEDVPEDARPFVRRYPEGPCVMMYYSQRFYLDDQSPIALSPNEDPDMVLVRMLGEYAEAAGTSLKGDYICETLIDSLSSLFETGEELYRVSIPVEDRGGISW